MQDYSHIRLTRVDYDQQVGFVGRGMEEYGQLSGLGYYPSAYACPHCGHNLKKGVFREHSEIVFGIENSNEKIKTVRVFACPNCNVFWFSHPGRNFDEVDADGIDTVYALPIKPEKFRDVASIFAAVMTSNGRQDDNSFI